MGGCFSSCFGGNKSSDEDRDEPLLGEARRESDEGRRETRDVPSGGRKSTTTTTTELKKDTEMSSPSAGKNRKHNASSSSSSIAIEVGDAALAITVPAARHAVSSTGKMVAAGTVSSTTTTTTTSFPPLASGSFATHELATAATIIVTLPHTTTLSPAPAPTAISSSASSSVAGIGIASTPPQPPQPPPPLSTTSTAVILKSPQPHIHRSLDVHALRNIVERAEEDLMDVGRSVDDIEREDPTDPAAIDFVRALRAVKIF